MSSQDERPEQREAAPAADAGPAAVDALSSAGQALRRRAEAHFQQHGAQPGKEIQVQSAETETQMLHELRVHQIELEMQNDELRRAQLELEASRALYFDLYDLAPVGLCSVGETGLIAEANLTFATLLGVARGVLVTQAISRFIVKEDQDIYYLLRKQLLVTGEPQACELRMVTQAGTQFWAHLATIAAHDAAGARLLRIVLSDIGERKQVEDALRESENRYRSLVANSPVCIHEIGLDGRITSMNNAGLLMLCAADESAVRGVLYLDAVCSEDRERIADLLARAYAGETSHFEFRASGPSGQIFKSCFIPIASSEGAIVRLMGITEDITERKRAEAEILRSNTELEQFSYSISHDMRQPLRMISSYLQLLEQDFARQLDAQKREYFNFAIDGAKRLDQMLVALLEYSRVGRMGEPRTWLKSRALLDEALLFLQPAIAEAQADVRIEGDWPRILVSPNELLRLLQNLIGNAIKFRVAGRTPQIVVASEALGERWRMSVADNGVGIIPDQIGRLFQMFQRLQSRADYEGTGIGLALCRKIAEHHQGRLWVESTGTGQGSTFYLELPIASQTGAPVEAQLPKAPA